jgi:DNA polymerase/3'-5' exonuclease PolX
MREPNNRDTASLLERIAERLKAQEANPYRVHALGEGAQSVRAAQQSLADLVTRGDEERPRELPTLANAWQL